MAPKTIAVCDRKIMIRSETHFKEWRKEEGVKSLVNQEEIEISDFESLEDGETYTLGSPRQIQPQPSLTTRFGELQSLRDQQQQFDDITVSWEANQSKAVSSLPHSDEMLKDFLMSQPADRAPIDSGIFNSWKRLIPEETLRLYFASVSNGDACLTLGRILSNLIYDPAIIPGTNEDAFHGRIGQCILNFLQRYTPTLVLRRNSSQNSSSTFLKRPDVIACIPGQGCYFRGEEKGFGSNEDPKLELHAKLQEVWPFPGLPYVLGYHSAGCFLTFSKILFGTAVDIAGPLNLDDATARLHCWNITRNVARLLNHMVAAPGACRIPMDMEDLNNGGGSGLNWQRTISFSGGRVVKECIVDTDILRQKQRRLEAVLSVLQHGLDGVQPIVRYKKSSRKRHRSESVYVETALGETIPRVESPEQLRSLVEFLLQTVRRLHNQGITHRDIRLPNIVKSITDDKFALIDWDESVMGIQNLENTDVAHLDENSHAPEMFVAGGRHDSSVDLWSIGYLVYCFQEHADTKLLELMNRLHVPASERLSDDEACRWCGIE